MKLYISVKKKWVKTNFEFILFVKDETDTYFIISLFNELHILTDLLLIIFLIELLIFYNYL